MTVSVMGSIGWSIMIFISGFLLGFLLAPAADNENKKAKQK